MVLFSLIIAITLLGSSQCLPQKPETANIDDLIASVFPSPAPGVTVVQPVPSGPNTGIVDGRGETDSGICAAGYDCVPYYLCKDNQIVRDGEGIIDIRFDGGTPCTDYLQTCCAIDQTAEKPITDHLLSTPEGCGYRNVDGIGFRITGAKANETEYGEFPWMVAILLEEKAGDETLNIYQCGGSLIAPNVVLTGAHCVNGKTADILKIRAGEWDTQTKTELFMDQDRDVSEIIIHENYYKGGLFNDIALLFLSTPVEFADNVKTVCLPPADFKFDTSRCFATGWGKDVFGQTGKYQVILKKIDLPIVPNDQCQNSLRTTRLGKYFELHNSFICAGGEPGKDTCKGDGGSPLVCPIPNSPNRYYQAGIVAWGIGCGETGIPGVYASVSHLRSWIDEQLEYKRIQKSHFTP